jgi:hypothetical protein
MSGVSNFTQRWWRWRPKRGRGHNNRRAAPAGEGTTAHTRCDAPIPSARIVRCVCVVPLPRFVLEGLVSPTLHAKATPVEQWAGAVGMHVLRPFESVVF